MFKINKKVSLTYALIYIHLITETDYNWALNPLNQQVYFINGETS